MNHRSRMIGRGAFTLIEIMAAVAVLALMVVFLANVFSNSTKVWKLGSKRIESNTSGRAAIEFMARELSSAHAVGGWKMHLLSDVNAIYGSAKAKSDVIAYVSSSCNPEDLNSSVTINGNNYSQNYVARQVRLSVFSVISTNGTKGPYALLHHNLITHKSVNPAYGDSTGWDTQLLKVTMDNSSVIADNVRNLEIFIYDQDPDKGPVPNYQSWTAGAKPPLFIDIYLEVLAEEDAIKAAAGANSDDDLTPKTRRYHTRVYMPNVQGALRDT